MLLFYSDKYEKKGPDQKKNHKGIKNTIKNSFFLTLRFEYKTSTQTLTHAHTHTHTAVVLTGVLEIRLVRNEKNNNY